MIKTFIYLLTFMLPSALIAQITISVQLPQAGLVQKDQLWNLVLVNNTNTQYDANIFLNLQDAATGQSVLSAGTRLITLPKGVKLLNAQEIQPIQYNLGAGGFSGNYLPVGSYIACYTVSRGANETVETLTNECVRLNIVPLSPPLLNTPADKSVLQTTTPQLTWIPPAPLSMFDNLNYELSVAEILEGQTPLQAIRQNTPIYIKTNTKLSYEYYPSSYSLLEKGKTYAWQVAAKNGFQHVAATEVWTFSIQPDSGTMKKTSASYVLLKSSGTEAGVNYLSGDTIHLKYYSFDKEHEGVVRFLDKKGKLVQEKKQIFLYGDNFLQLRLGRRFRKEQTYTIEIIDSQHQKYTASFSIK